MKFPKRPSKEELFQLLQVFNSFHPVGKGVEQFLLRNVFYRDLTKGKFLLRNGEHCDNVYFIKKGLLRGFIIEEEEEKEITTWFAMENELVTAVSTFVLQSPTRENIHA